MSYNFFNYSFYIINLYENKLVYQNQRKLMNEKEKNENG